MARAARKSGKAHPARVSSAGSEIAGHSSEGRPLTVQFCGDPKARVRIFILAGQHGDEPEARQAAAEFLARVAKRKFRAPAFIAVLVDANPDGAAAGTRRNARDADLNRDHLLLSEPETAAVHAFVDAWKPDFVVDVHTYRAWRRDLAALDLVYAQDIMIDFPTNPAIATSVGAALRREAMDFLHRRMARSKIRSDHYTIIRSGIVRHSNYDIVDARNGLALRFGIPVILIEGRRSSPDDVLTFTPPALALLHSIEAAVTWASANARQLKKHPQACKANQAVPVRCCYSGSRAPRRMEMQSAAKGKIERVRIPGSYLPKVRATGSVRLPAAYGVPRSLSGVLDLLSKHRLASAPPRPFRSSRTEVYTVDAITPATEADAPPIANCSTRAKRVDLDDLVLFPVNQIGGRLLALLLEPESQFGPSRIPELAETLQPGSAYPIVRLF